MYDVVEVGYRWCLAGLLRSTSLLVHLEDNSSVILFGVFRS